MSQPPTLVDVVGGEIPPAPNGGDLVMPVRCRAGGDAEGRAHEIVLHPDWTLDTPHDLAAERVAAAFGGSVSCIDLVDRVLPAARGLVQLVSRRLLPPIEHAPGGGWAPYPRQGRCCLTATALPRDQAARHVRDARHAAAVYEANSADVAALAGRVLAAHSSAFDAALPAGESAAAAHCVPDESDLVRLWDCGIHPALVRAIHAALGIGARPLRADFYLTVLKWEADLDWVHQHAVRLPESMFDPRPRRRFPRPAIDKIPPDIRAGWLVTGISPNLIETMHSAGYTAAEIEQLSHETGRQPMGYATVLVGWLSAGCLPTTQQLLELHKAGVSAFYRPSAPAIARAFSALDGALPGATVTDVGLLLAVAGSVPEAVRWGRAGYRDPAVVARLIKEGRSAPAATGPQQPTAQQPTAQQKARQNRAHAS